MRMERVHYIGVLSLLVVLMQTYGQTTRTIPSSLIVFAPSDWIYFENTTAITYYRRVRDRLACGHKCVENVNCVSFLYLKTTSTCRLSSDILNTTGIGAWDYAGLTIPQ